MTEVFDRAIERIRERGLWQERPRSCARGTCIMLALGDQHEVGPEEFEHHARFIYQALGVTSFGEAIAWNDAPGRTAEEVVEVLQRAKELQRDHAP